MHKFLIIPRVFDFAESHLIEYKNSVETFVKQYLSFLEERREASNAYEEIFNLYSRDEVELTFFLLRYLIRQNNNDKHLVSVDALLSIPSVREKVANRGNELLKLALQLNNEIIARRLMSVREVSTLASQENFYAAEFQGSIDLRQLAHETRLATIIQNKKLPYVMRFFGDSSGPSSASFQEYVPGYKQ